MSELEREIEKLILEKQKKKAKLELDPSVLEKFTNAEIETASVKKETIIEKEDLDLDKIIKNKDLFIAVDDMIAAKEKSAKIAKQKRDRLLTQKRA